MKDSERQAIINLLKIEREEKKRYKHNALLRYNSGDKIHKKQIEFHKCQKRNRWVFGGNRSGKTECGAVEAIWWARGNHPYRENRNNVAGWVVSLTYEVQREVAQAKILHYLNPEWIEDIVMLSGKKGSPEYGIIDHIVIKNVFGGTSRIAFKSVDQGRERFQGASLDFVWFDEEPPKDIYDECRMRVLDRCGEIWATMTPLKGLTWVYDEIYMNRLGNPEVWYEQIEWADNPFLDKSEIELLTKTLSEGVDSRRYGNFDSESGLVYKEFDITRHVIEPFEVDVMTYDNISIDPGLNNPLACLFFAVDYDGNIYVIGEHYEAGRDIDYHAEKIHGLANELQWHRDTKGRLEALIDTAATQRTLSSTKSVADLFYEKGIVVNPRVNKELFAGIARVKEYFVANKIFIFANCTNLIRELKSYWWSKGDRPRKVDDHALDALRYYIMTKPRLKAKSVQDKSIIVSDKEKLIKQFKANKCYRNVGGR